MEFLMELLKWIDKRTIAIATVALVGVTIYYARVTKKILKESEQMRRDAQKPRIGIHLGIEKEKRMEGPNELRVPTLYMYVTNIGMGPAYDVDFDTNPEFLLPDMRLLRDIEFIDKGIRYLPPGQTRKFVLGDRYSEGKTMDQLMEEQLKIRVTYKDIRNKEPEEEFCINFGEYESEYRQMVAE